MFFGSWATIASTFTAYVIFMFWTLFYCTPRRMIWFKLIPGGKCHDVNNIILSQGAFNMVSDIVILLLPTASLWRLNVPLSKKIFITSMFATGLLYVLTQSLFQRKKSHWRDDSACAASAMRIIFTTKIASVISTADVSHNGLFIGLWTEAEVSLGFIVACSLCLPKLVQVKGKKVRNALSYASWSTRSRKSGSWSSERKSNQDSRASKQVEGGLGLGRPMFYEEREEERRRCLQTERNKHDIYVVPSSAGNSSGTPSWYSESRYSQSSKSKRSSSGDEDSIHLAAVARPAFPRTVSVRTQDVPLRLDPKDMTMEQLEEERMVLQHFDFKYLTVMIDSGPKLEV
jgi:hypothetical protein